MGRSADRTVVSYPDPSFIFARQENELYECTNLFFLDFFFSFFNSGW